MDSVSIVTILRINIVIMYGFKFNAIGDGVAIFLSC
jgi:hypothetical protein